jgi:hypothetical protein
VATPQTTCHIDFQPRESIKTLKFSSHHLRQATNLISKPKPKSHETNFGVFSSGLRKGARFSQMVREACWWWVMGFAFVGGVLYISLL